MLSKSSVYEIKRISFGVFILSIIQMIVVLIAFGYNNSYLFGTLLGASVAILNFVFLAISVENSVKKSQGAAKGYMGSGYFLRLMFMGLIIYFAINSPYINHWATIIPLIFPRITIMLLGIIDSKKGGRKNEC